jgi:atypical dual specificity phosphatase
MAKPAKLRTDLEFLKDQGIGLVITLTTAPLTRCFIDEFGFEYRHIPIRDFAAPTQEQIDEFVTAVSEARERGTKVLVHCLAGVGRSGAMLSCYLVHGGKTAAEAIAEVRRLRPGSIETPGQEQAVYEYEKRIRKKTRDE